MKTENASGVYMILSKFDYKVYVGSSYNIAIRWKSHRKQLNAGTHKNIHLQRAWNKYNEDNFIFFVVENCDKSLLVTREQYWIDFLCACNPEFGYNINKKADRVTYTKEVRQKLSEKTKEYMNQPEVKKRLSQQSKRLGYIERYIHSHEGRDLLHKLATQKRTDKQLKSLSQWNNSKEGKQHHKALVQIVRKRTARKVYQYTADFQLVSTYETPSDVDYVAVGCSKNSISRSCRENYERDKEHQKIFKGFIWSYKELK